jgi:hypothetical protein
LLFLIYTAAIFIFNSRIRSLAHIVGALFCVLLWAVFRFAIFPPLAAFAISKSDMEGEGLFLFIAAAVLGIAVGILELFPSIDRQL